DDPSATGSHAVGEARVSVPTGRFSTREFDVLYPEDARGPRPVVLLLHGWLGARTDYEPLARHLASRGFAVAIGGHPTLGLDPKYWASWVKENIDGLEKLNADPASPIAGKLDLSRLGVGGHSLGGAAAVTLAATDPRVKAVVAL